jgi:penicillin amidase
MMNIKPFYFLQSYIFFLFFSLIIISCAPGEEGKQIQIRGLHAPVEVLRDSLGINHIYAKNQHDLFFAQGYCAARDRLFQFEIWRRQATGTIAEILGPRELKRDIGTRLFKFRADMNTEMNYYHPDGEQIIRSFVDGVNAYIDKINEDPDKLPVEFKFLGIRPQPWTPEVVISRHQGLLGNINQELAIGRSVARIGPENVKDLLWFHPKDPVIKLDTAIDGKLLFENILELYNAFRRSIDFAPEDIPEAFRSHLEASQFANSIQPTMNWGRLSEGSNNWVVNGDLTASEFPVMANDPHRNIAVPSLRYMAHLIAPGWNVIGGGEPEIPGISIGHNGFGAWGLTVYSTDGEDLYVYDLNPSNLNQYKYRDDWEDFQVYHETINVKGEEDVEVALRYTRHGPVTYFDSLNNKAYAVRCAWLEPGGSPYLASLRMDQAESWEEFRDACNYSHIPGENMVWADKENNIGWQAVGIAPLRRNFSGLVPVPGDGRYEWDGYLPIKEKPHVFNPGSGFFATANQHVTPESYNHWDAIGFIWSDPFRGERINDVLGSGKLLDMEDMIALQTDYFSIPAKTLVPYLQPISFNEERLNQAKEMLLDWDFVLGRNSIPAGIYVGWENKIREMSEDRFIPDEVKGLISLQLTKIMTWIRHPDMKFGKDPVAARDDFLREAFSRTIDNLVERLGEDMHDWQYGQEQYKHIYIRHPLSFTENNEWRDKLNIGPVPRGGNSYTPNSTGGNNNQSSGATFRIIADTEDWDKSVAINSPGQSGDPDSPFYDNLFHMWANDQYFPLYYSRDKIEKILAEKIVLKPLKFE